MPQTLWHGSLKAQNLDGIRALLTSSDFDVRAKYDDTLLVLNSLCTTDAPSRFVSSVIAELKKNKYMPTVDELLTVLRSSGTHKKLLISKLLPDLVKTATAVDLQKMWAIGLEQEDAAFLKTLICSPKFDTNMKLIGGSGATPLLCLAEKEVKSQTFANTVAQSLLLHGADRNARDRHGYNILHYAKKAWLGNS